MCRLHRPSACAVRTADSRRLGRDTALCLAASSGHSATISALVFAGADGDVSNNNGYGKRRGSAWVRSSHAFGLGRETADELAEEEGTLDEYEGAVRKVRRVQRLTGRPEKGCAGSGRSRLVAAGGSRTAGAHRVPSHTVSAFQSFRFHRKGEGGLWLKHLAASLLRVVGLCSRACDGLPLWCRRWRCLSALRYTAHAEPDRCPGLLAVTGA